MSRRRALQIGGVTILGGALLAACGSDSDDAGSTTAGGDATTGAPTTGAASTMSPSTRERDASMDVLILRTASSIEELAVAAYQTAIDSGLVTTAAIADAAMLFQAQHREHSGLFQSLTTKAGGEPFTMPNPAILEAIQPTIDGLKDEMGVVALAYDLEVVAAQTYQSNVADVRGRRAQRRHHERRRRRGPARGRTGRACSQQNPVPAAFQVTDKAVMAGTGV